MSAELHVIGAGVFEDHAEIESTAGNSQCSQGGRFKLPEGPFVGLGDEGNGLRLDNLMGVGRGSEVKRRFLMGD